MLVGTKTADDAAVWRLSEDTALVQTVDYITPIVDDPFDYGAIAAANSVSDVYAMGAKPLFALNVVGFPQGCLPLSVLRDILRGGMEKMAEAGVPTIGGHTVDDAEPKYGLSVTGVVHPDRVWTNAGAQPGDALILTKPLGSGIITTAAKRGEAPDDVLRAAVEAMSTLNDVAAEVGAGFDIHACTDITGFGFLGHLHEMTTGSGVGARVELSQVPLLPHAAELAAQDMAPGGTHRNREALAEAARWGRGVSEEEQLILCDAQTSGGLLLAVAPSDSTALMLAMGDAGGNGWRVGEILDDPSGRIEIAA